MTTYFILSCALVLVSAASAALILAPTNRITSTLAALAITVTAFLSFRVIDYSVGMPHPESAVLGWQHPKMGDDGAKVLGGRVDDQVAYLVIQEKGQAQPRYWSFPMTDEMRRQLKQAMDRHAKANGGNPWGFMMKEAKGNGNGAEGQGKGPGGGSAGDPGSGKLSPFAFVEPKTEPLPPKDS